MKHCIIAVLLLLSTLALLQGCKRKAPTDAADVQSDTTGELKSESGIEMVKLPAGRFTMGDENEIDAVPHEVVVSPFLIDKYPVTQEEYKRVMEGNPSRWKSDKNPVEQVRWSDAVRYCNARSLLEGLQPCYDLETWECNFDANGYRLPTEAEWEYACRAGTKTIYFFGNDPSKLTDYAWFDKNSNGRPQPVGQKRPNPWGLYDTFTKLTTIRKALKRIRKARRPVKPRWYAAAHGSSVPRAVAPVIVTMKPPATRTSALDTIFMAFVVLETPPIPLSPSKVKSTQSSTKNRACNVVPLVIKG
jgi:hypothetical protein